MITREEAGQLRDQLLQILNEDAHNTSRLVARLDGITRETGIGAHSALLLILTRLGFDEDEARRHWEKIVEHHAVLTRTIGRDPGVRVAILDYFVNVNKRIIQPALIDLELLEGWSADATRDGGTGLATDRVFRTTLQRELRRARRYRQSVAVVLFDLDDFADVNQRFGALIADRLLREAAILLSNAIRDIDFAARPGEDEFALLLPETDRPGGLLVADRFRRKLQTFFASRDCGEAVANLTVSAGVACYPEDATTAEPLVRHAAQALYQAKASRKNTVQVYQPERRRYLRFELEPGRFEVEVLRGDGAGGARARNLSRNGIVFLSPERLEIGERLEIRMIDPDGTPDRPLRLRGAVVRVEALPESLPIPGEGEPGAEAVDDHWEIGLAFDLAWGDSMDDLIEFLEQIQQAKLARRS